MASDPSSCSRSPIQPEIAPSNSWGTAIFFAESRSRKAWTAAARAAAGRRPSSSEAAKRVADSPLGRSIATGSVPLPNIEDQRFREAALQMLAPSEAIKERAHAVRLRTVLELVTDATGGLADVSVLERSGDLTFDESAIHLSRKVLREQIGKDALDS